MALWPGDLAHGLRQALGNPDAEAIRSLLASVLAPDESGALFSVGDSAARLVAAFPRAEPFALESVRRLASEASVASPIEGGPDPTIEPDAPLTAEWPAALALPLVVGGETRSVLVLLARTAGGISAESRSRAMLLAPLLGLVAELGAASLRARQAEAQLAHARQMLPLAKPGRDLAEISQAVLDIGVPLIDGDSAALWLRTRRGADFELRAARRPLSRRAPRPTLGASEVEPLLGAAALTCPPYPLVLPQALLGDDSVAAGVLIPIHHDGDLVGLLAVGRVDRDRPFGPGDAERLLELADLATVPIVNVCLRKDVRERTRQMRASRRIAKGLSAALPLEEIFHIAARELRGIIGFDAAAMVVLDETGESGQILVEEIGQPARRLPWVPESPDGVTGTVIRTRRAAVVPDLAATSRPLLPVLRDVPGARAMVSIPLGRAPESVGALVLLSRTRGRFRRSDVRRLRPAAEQLGLAARQARLQRATTAGLEERRRLEARLARAERHATIGRLLGALAHEIRNPLTVIGTTVQYLRDRLPPGHEHRPLLDAADRKVREMDDSLEGVMSFSRPLELRPQPVDVRDLLEGVAGAVRGQAGRQGVEVTVDTAPALPGAMLDRRQMEQALLNLALNALDAMPSGGGLAFAGRTAPDGNLLLTVSDTGSGIEDGDLSTIFEPSSTPKRRGTGFRLAITRRIVEEHGGAIEATGEPGGGTAFAIAFSAESRRPDAAHG